jgi:hypothetical protein
VISVVDGVACMHVRVWSCLHACVSMRGESKGIGASEDIIFVFDPRKVGQHGSMELRATSTQY